MLDTFDSLRPYLRDYLHMKGINPAKRFRCLNPNHLDRNPSMGFDAKRKKVHCFACGADYDLFDLLMIDQNLPTAKEALREASRLYGHDNIGQTPQRTSGPSRALEGETGGGGEAARLPVLESTPKDYLSACHAQWEKTRYFADRGLSPETAERFGLGYDPQKECVVLPCEQGRFILRSTSGKKYLNEKGAPSPLFQPELLEQDEPVFLTEGAFDALSAEELGFRAAALNGSGNREKVAAILRKRAKPGPVLLVPDNDTAGEAWATALEQEFPWLYRCPPVPSGKDLNESLTADRAGTAQYLAGCLAEWKQQAPPPYGAQSAAGRLGALAQYITAQAARPGLKTGFPKLDAALDGGLYDGLYVLGAISSLGKTAFCMQIADQLAQRGQDVLIFSLEMSEYELMARSISRETFLSDQSKGRKLAKTVRGVLDGKRYFQYSLAEHAHLQAATDRYAAYGGHLWFREGDHETGVETMEREVRRHIEETGAKPVVIVDYLQIIAPADVHFTDKQNLDRNVCSLKKLSRKYELTVLAISSFNRENYNAEASMAAFKESGGIDYSADVLLGLQAQGAGGKNFNIDAEKRKDPRELELKILKNRTAGLGKPVPFRYYPAFSCFEEA